ncbi:hypothetical protein KCU67_g10888, partial [Aureobasidium melanogenum]
MPPNQYSAVDRQWYTSQAHTYHEPMPPNQYSSAGRQGYTLPAPGYPDAMPPNYSHGNQRLTASNKQPEIMPHKQSVGRPVTQPPLQKKRPQAMPYKQSVGRCVSRSPGEKMSNNSTANAAPKRKLIKTVSSRQEHPKSALHAVKMSLYQGPAAKKARVIANSPDEEDDSDDATEDTLRVLSPRPGSDCTTQKHVAVTDKDVINEYIRQYRLGLPAVSSLWYQL